MSEHSRPMREDARVALVATTKLRAHPRNVRADLGDLRELAESIRFEGVLVPLMAERRGDHLRILHGHRRWTPPSHQDDNPTQPAQDRASRQPDWAACEALLSGRLKARDVHSSDCAEVIRQLTEAGQTAQEIGIRIGMSERNVVRHRNGHLGRRSA